jgi:integrase
VDDAGRGLQLFQRRDQVVEVIDRRRGDESAQGAPRVPLLEAMAPLRGKDSDLLFPSRSRGQLSDMTLTKAMRDMGVSFTVHGLRSAFRFWLDFPPGTSWRTRHTILTQSSTLSKFPAHSRSSRSPHLLVLNIDSV